MPTNDFIGFASAGSANVMSQADYAAAAEQIDGVQPGPASSALANKIWRQGANMSAALGAFIASSGYDAIDNGDIDSLQSNLTSALRETGNWTPILAGETTEGSLSYSTRDGTYVKIGRLVLLQCKLVVSDVGTMPAGYAIIKGLPYNISSAALLPLRGLGGDSNCARKVVFAANNANNANILRITGVNPSSIATTGQIESLKWSTTSTSADNIKFANSNPFIEFNISGCYLTSA